MPTTLPPGVVEPRAQASRSNTFGPQPSLGAQRVQRGEDAPQPIGRAGLVDVGGRHQHRGRVPLRRPAPRQLVVAHRHELAAGAPPPAAASRARRAGHRPPGRSRPGRRREHSVVPSSSCRSSAQPARRRRRPTCQPPRTRAGWPSTHGDHRSQARPGPVVDLVAEHVDGGGHPGLGRRGRVHVDGHAQGGQHGQHRLGSGFVPRPRHVPVARARRPAPRRGGRAAPARAGRRAVIGCSHEGRADVQQVGDAPQRDGGPVRAVAQVVAHLVERLVQHVGGEQGMAVRRGRRARTAAPSASAR